MPRPKTNKCIYSENHFIVGKSECIACLNWFAYSSLFSKKLGYITIKQVHIVIYLAPLELRHWEPRKKNIQHLHVWSGDTQGRTILTEIADIRGNYHAPFIVLL